MKTSTKTPMRTKTFRIQDIIFTELSHNKGPIEYFLVDTMGRERKVTGVAKLGFNRKIKSVKAVYHREIPLIEALLQADVGQRITVDFSDFNQSPRIKPNASTRNPRIHAAKRSKGDISATMIYQDIYDDLQYQDKIRNLLPDFSKSGLWLLLAFVLWLIYMSMNQFV